VIGGSQSLSARRPLIGGSQSVSARSKPPSPIKRVGAIAIICRPVARWAAWAVASLGEQHRGREQHRRNNNQIDGQDSIHTFLQINAPDVLLGLFHHTSRENVISLRDTKWDIRCWLGAGWFKHRYPALKQNRASL
jgi:hypothetical protein